MAGKKKAKVVRVVKTDEDAYQLVVDEEKGKRVGPIMSELAVKAFIMERLYSPRVDAIIRKADEKFAFERETEGEQG